MAISDIAPEQCRAARAYLGWSQRELAERTGVNRLTVMDFEGRRWKTAPEIRQRIRAVFEEAGVRFEGADAILPWTREAGP